MGKKGNFIKELEKELEKELKNSKYKKKIIGKYNTSIDEKLSNGEKIGSILKKLGPPVDIVKEEIKKYSTSSSFKDFFRKIFNNIILKFKNIKIETIKKAINKNIMLFLLEIILFITVFYLAVIFSASLFALFDGIKIYGIVIILLSLIFLNILLIDILNKKRINIKLKYKKYFVYTIILLLSIAVGISYTTYSYFKISYINIPDDKYKLTYKELEYKMPKEGKMNIYFNSWYNMAYSVKYDESLKNKVRIEIKYNEVFYDLNTQSDKGDVYISLAFDSRDLFSMYLNNLKENKIYNQKELGRYLVKIYINEEDKDRIEVHN